MNPLPPRLLSLVVVMIALGAAPLCAQSVTFGDFECQLPSSPFPGGPPGDCEGWNEAGSALPGTGFVSGALGTLAGMPSSGFSFGAIISLPMIALTVPGNSVPQPTAGNTTPLWPITGGSIQRLSTDVIATATTVELEWSIAKDAAGPHHFAQILIIDPQTDQLIAPLLVTDTTQETLNPGVLPSPSPAGGVGLTPLDASSVQTASANLPTSYLGQPIRIVAMFGSLIPVSAFVSGPNLANIDGALLIDNVRFFTPPPAAETLLLSPNTTLNLTNPAGPGTFSASGTITGFIDPQGNTVTNPLIDPIVGASFSLSGNLLSAGADLRGGVLAATVLDIVISPGQDELDVVAQYNHEASLDRFGLGGSPEVIPFATRVYRSPFTANTTRTGSGSTVLDTLDTDLGLAGRQLGLEFELFPGQPTRLDRLVLDPAPPPAIPEFNFDTDGIGSIVLGVAGADPQDELFNLFVVNPTVAFAQGPFFGTEFTPLVADILATPLGTLPFHVSPDAEGAYFWGSPPGSLPPGLVLDGLAATMDPLTGLPTWIAPVVRRTF